MWKFDAMTMVPNDMQGVNYDRHVFKLILVLATIFMTAYILGISIPYWFVLQENVSNFSRCISSNYYGNYDSFRNGNNDKDMDNNQVMLMVRSSLWYLLIHVRSNSDQVSTFILFIGIHSSPYGNQEGVVSVNDKPIVTSEQPNSLACLMMFALLAFGLVSGWRASMKPSRRIFYGISVICIVLGTTIWIAVAMQNGKNNVILVAVEHCSYSGQVMTAPFLHLLMGSLGMLALVFGLLLIHFSTLTSFSIPDWTELHPHNIEKSERSSRAPMEGLFNY
ncbi:hypothetical protein CHS0354_015634 [Potamilus streckersoni]|uniref:Uncharacterized protein n=1 Tax=Potamilus streckersoni TaxID=2493646 RepID=A0AAE0T5Y7_9BIVA|nr:hypothetical protein CHS0354_015634 [Potamilus streckersoni]